MPELTPISEGSESLAAVAADTQTLTGIGDDTQALGRLYLDMPGYEYQYPASFTYPSATTYPGEWGALVGFRLAALSEGAETLSPLTED